jgi:hypothetical protein
VRSRRDAFEHLGARERDVGVGPALAVGAGAVGEAEAVGVEAEVAARMKTGFGTSQRRASRPLSTKRAAAPALKRKSGAQTSAETIQNASPRSGSALAMPPAVSSAPP